MREIVNYLMRYCSWCFEDRGQADLYVREKLLDDENGWYRKLKLNNLKWHLSKWGWILKEKNINVILFYSETAYLCTKETMQEQKTWDDFEGKSSVWAECVRESTAQLFEGRGLPDPNGTHAAFYWIVVSLVGKIQKGRRAKKIKEEEPILSDEIRAQIEPILYPLFYKRFFGSGNGRRFERFMSRISKRSRGNVGAIKRHAEFVNEFVKDKNLKDILDEINIKKNMTKPASCTWIDVAEKVLRRHGWERRSDGVKLSMVLDLFFQTNLIVGDYYPDQKFIAA